MLFEQRHLEVKVVSAFFKCSSFFTHDPFATFLALDKDATPCRALEDSHVPAVFVLTVIDFAGCTVPFDMCSGGVVLPPMFTAPLPFLFVIRLLYNKFNGLRGGIGGGCWWASSALFLGPTTSTWVLLLYLL